MTHEAGMITTYAGTGEPGYTGDGGPAVRARLSEPFMCAFDSRGNLYVAEATNHCVRRIDHQSGVITTVAGSGAAGYTGDGGPATQATMNQPYSLQIDGADHLYIVDRLNAVIRKVDSTTGVMTTIAGTGEPGSGGDGGPGMAAQLREPNDCCLDGHGGLLIADVQDQRVRRLDLATGIITTVAGNGDKARAGDGRSATEASLFGARAVCVDGHGTMYICEREGNGIRKVDRAGIISTFAGTGEHGYSGDGGLARSATWGAPKALRCDQHGNVLVVDTENHAIRRIDVATGMVTTIAGGHQGSDGDGGPATAAGLDRPHGCAVDTQGNLFIADSNNHRVRVVGA
jgi:sugar lactone lactonase YvrE